MGTTGAIALIWLACIVVVDSVISRAEPDEKHILDGGSVDAGLEGCQHTGT